MFTVQTMATDYRNKSKRARLSISKYQKNTSEPRIINICQFAHVNKRNIQSAARLKNSANVSAGEIHEQVVYEILYKLLPPTNEKGSYTESKVFTRKGHIIWLQKN